MKQFYTPLMVIGVSLILAGCTSDDDFKNRLKETLVKNPEVITEMIEKNPAVFMEALQKAARTAQTELKKKAEEDEKKNLEQYIEKPLNMSIRKDDAIRGSRDGKITVFAYSDFECPFCSRGFSTVQELMDKNDGNVRFILRHLPLSFHPNAMIASQYYEALRLQDEKMAFKYHDELYKNQGKLRNGKENYLKTLSKSLGADMKKLAKDVTSKAVTERIEADMKEASQLGFEGTPGFVLNGVPIKGAYPLGYFENILQILKDRGKL